MKAQERHQLQKNVLASGMTKLVEEGKKSSGSMLLGIALLVAVLIVAWYMWTANAADRISVSWMNWWDSRSTLMDIGFMPDEELKKMADQARGSAADYAAQLTLADQLYEKGYQTSFRDSPAAAAKHFEEASTVYTALSSTANTRDVALRALIGAARSQESLGDLKKAIEVYKKVVARYAGDMKGPDGVLHPLVADAQARIASLETGDGLAFYKDTETRQPWPQRLPPTNKVNTPPFGEMPPPPPGANIDDPSLPFPPPGPPEFPEVTPSGQPMPPPMPPPGPPEFPEVTPSGPPMPPAKP